MKNIFLLLMLLLAGGSTYAQQFQQNTAPSAEKKSNFVRHNTSPLKALHADGAKKKRGGSRWYDIVDAIDKGQGGGGAIYSNDNYNIIWQDSTMLAPFTSGANTVYDGIWIKSIAAFFDPADPRYNDPATYPGEVAISRSSSYTLDSIFLPFIYRRNASKPGIVDTLIVSVIKGSGGGNNNDLAIRYYGPTTNTAINHATDTLRFLHGFLNLNTTSPDVFTFAASTPSNVVNIKIPLTAATAVDTLSNGFNYFQIPINMLIPSANIPGISVSFKSGDTWVPYVDTLYISGNTNPNFNHFRFVAFEETAGQFQTYIKNYWSQSSIMKNDTTGWKNWHIPSYAFTSSTYEHFWFSWKATCANCGSVGVNNLEENVASINVFPNPVQNSLNITVHTTETLLSPKVQLLSFDGKIIYEEQTADIQANSTYTNVINTQHFAKGIYILKLNTSKGLAAQKVVIE